MRSRRSQDQERSSTDDRIAEAANRLSQVQSSQWEWLSDTLPGNRLYWAGIVWVVVAGGFVLGSALVSGDVIFAVVTGAVIVVSVVGMLLRIRDHRRG